MDKWTLYNLKMKNLFFRKADGKKYSSGVLSIKESIFPYPVESEASGKDERDTAASADGESRSEASYREQIAVLQAMLHTATTQLELANSDSVGHAKKVEELECEKEASKVKFKDMNIENQVLKRKINVLVPEDGLAKLPRPGPSLKPFEDLTPRQRRIASHDLQAKILNTSKERKIHPTKLSSFMTYRYWRLKMKLQVLL